MYSREILQGLAAAHAETTFFFCYRWPKYLRAWRTRLPANCTRTLLGKSGPGEAALFHGLNQRLPSHKLKKAVVTFHDLFVISGDYSTAEFRRRFTAQAREAAAAAELIIAVSAFTAGQVCDLLGVEASRLRVVHHGTRVPQGVPGERERMVLHVGGIQRRKNVVRLVDAFRQMPPGWRLVLAGSAGYGAEEALERIRLSPRAADIQIAGFVSDRVLEEFYAKAAIFAFPSLDEGFGMPVLDAMARGVPVIASRRSALPEVCGDAALLVDPLSCAELAAALNSLAESKDRREEMAERGRRNAAKFTWEKAVAETWQVYRELLD